tara:strand:+ start:120 stop:773 length:654 start_codon:yes stop_codon:yes gene_type:complete
MSNQVNVPILANNKIRKHNMSDIKQVKLNKTIQASIKATGLVIPNYLNSNKVLQQATGKVDIEAFIIIGNMISVYSHDLDKHQLELYKKKMLQIGMLESDFLEKRKVANSPVFKSIITPNSSHQAVIRELEKLGLKTMTSVKNFKREHKVIDGKLKAKKDLPTNTVQSEKPIEEKPKDLLTMIKSLSNEDLQNLSDLVNQEIELRGQNSENKNALTG